MSLVHYENSELELVRVFHLESILIPLLASIPHAFFMSASSLRTSAYRQHAFTLFTPCSCITFRHIWLRFCFYPPFFFHTCQKPHLLDISIPNPVILSCSSVGCFTSATLEFDRKAARVCGLVCVALTLMFSW